MPSIAPFDANVVHHDLDLHFQGHDIWNVNISKTVRASEKCSIMTFIEVDICDRIGPLFNAVLRDLELSFRGRTFHTLISQKRRTLA